MCVGGGDREEMEAQGVSGGWDFPWMECVEPDSDDGRHTGQQTHNSRHVGPHIEGSSPYLLTSGMREPAYLASQWRGTPAPA